MNFIQSSYIDPDDGGRDSLRNVGFELKIDEADRSRGFYITLDEV
jgi:hypothetical protein